MEERQVCSTISWRVAIAALCINVVMPLPAAFAQEAGTLLKNFEAIPTPAAPANGMPSPQQEPARPTSHEGARVLVKDFRIEATRFTEAQLKAVVQYAIGKELTLAELQDVTLKIAEYYRAQGFLARAYLPPQTIEDGNVIIRVIEGKVENIIVDPASRTRLDEGIALGIMASRLKVGEALKPGAMQEGLMVLNEVPGVAATTGLQPGLEEGGSIIAVNVNDSPLLSGMGIVDNGGVRSAGEERAIGFVSLNNALGKGEQGAFTAVKTAHSNYGRIAMTAPVNYTGLRMGINGSLLNYGTDSDFSTAEQTGHAWTAGLTMTYPLLRALKYSLSATTTYDYKHLSNSLFDINTSVKNIHVGTVGLEGLRSDNWLGGGVSNAAAGLTIGHLDLSDNPGNEAVDKVTADTAGGYAKFTGEISRLQTLNETLQLHIGVNAQAALQNLDSSEQISLGGTEGVRAYPSNEALGDSGAAARAEVRKTIIEGFQLIGFYDAGWVMQHSDPWAGWNVGSGQPNSYWLHGAGVGANWLPTADTRLSLTLGRTLGDNNGQIAGRNSDGRDNEWRLWLQASFIY